MTRPPGLTRRIFIAGAAILALPRDVRGAEPSRVACLEWTAAEAAISLGLKPIAVTDVDGYRDWMVAPALPDGVLDLGSRFEPNLERLSELAPDLVVVSRSFGRLREVARIAPAHDYTPYPVGPSALASARVEATRLAERVGRPDAAMDLVRRTDAEIENARQKLAGRPIGPICVISIFDRALSIYGKGGLFHEVMDRLGLQNAWTGPTNRWGFATTGLDQLAGLSADVRLVTLEPVPPYTRARLSKSALWRTAPPVNAGRVATIAPVWPFGGLASAARFATLLADGLAAA